MNRPITASPVQFRSANGVLCGCIFRPTASGPNARLPAVLFVHGDGSSQAPYYTRAKSASQEISAVCLTFDLSGHGIDSANRGRYSAHEHLEDVVVAFDYLASYTGVDPSRIGVCGASYGAYLAALLSGKRATVKRLVLRAPSLLSDVDPPLPSPDSMALDSLEALARYSGDTLVVESENDEVIPVSTIDSYVHASVRAQRLVIAGATHALTDTRWDQHFIEAIVGWFREL